MTKELSWLWLLLAGLFEIGWPIGMKLQSQPAWRVAGPALSVACILVSMGLFWLALRGVPLGLAYAVWTGIGAAGTFLVGVAVFGEAALLLHWVGVALILGGVACLKLA
jgi:quaternary ammonium compound-resistance protein SugE